MAISVDYIAGLIDGEGTISIFKNKIRVLISNTNKEVLDKTKEFLNFGFINEYKKKNKKYKTEYRYSTRNNDESYKLLSMIKNSLIIKKEKCIKAMEVLNKYYEKIDKYHNDKIKALELLKTHSVRETAKILGYTHGSVGRWRKAVNLMGNMV